MYVLPEFVIKGPVVETPETIDDCEEPIEVPPVVVTEDCDELTEDIIEPEFDIPKVIPEEPEEPVEEMEAV